MLFLWGNDPVRCGTIQFFSLMPDKNVVKM